MARKVKNWSEMLEEIQFRRSFVYREGCKFVYDSGDLPDSLVGVAPGTVLALRRPHGITATQMPGKAEDWIVIGSGEGGSIPQIVDEDLDEVSTNAVQNKVIKEALDSKVSTVAQNYTDRQKENARTNIGAQEDIASMDDVQPINAALNDRAAVSANVDGVSKLRSMGYKVLKAPDAGDITTSFQRQLAPIVDGTAQPITNTVFEVKDYFDLGNETFTMPANSKLKIVGGKIDNGTLNLNKCQIEATNGWIGENLIISGNTSSDVYADWFQGSDADMIELAIQQFANVKLYPRIYTINRPIVIGNNFSLIGSSIGDFFGANGEGNTIGATATQLKPINNTLHCLLDVRGSNADQNSSTHPIHLPKRSKTKARYISASIMGVAFMSNVTSVGGVTDGIWWSTPGGPSRPINIVNCTFKGLRHGIDIFRDNVDSGIQTTNFGDSYFQQCVFASNIWGIYVEGTQSVSNMVMQSCVMEDNHHYNGYETGGGIYSASNGTFCGNLRLRDNLFEGQRYGVVIKGMDLNVEFSGNYFEWKNGQNNVLYNNNTNSTRKAKLILDIDTVTHASKTRFDIRGFEVEQRQYSGLSYLINNYFNECLLKNNISLEDIKLSQIHGAVSALEKVMIDIGLPEFLGEFGNVYRLIYRPKKGDDKIKISTSLKEAKEPVMIYSSGVNNYMRELGVNPFGIKKDYKLRDKRPNYYYALEKANDPKTLKGIIDSIERNYNTILGINLDTDIYTLGTYIPKSLQSEEMKIFRDLAVAYNEELLSLCKQYGITFVNTEEVGNKYNNSENNFHISTAGHYALANYILGLMYYNKFEENDSIDRNINPIEINNKGSLGVKNDLLLDYLRSRRKLDDLSGYEYDRGMEIADEHLREVEVFQKVLKRKG